MARTHAALTVILLLRSAVAGDHGHQVAAWVRDTTLPLADRLAAWKNASGACADPVDVATCAHKNNKLPCAPLRDGCARPCGAFAVKLYGTGAVTIREGVLLHLYGSEPRVMGVEGSSFADARYLAKAETYAKMGAKFVIAFREPVQRIVSRYWYDGRWPHGGPKRRSAAPLELGAWIDAVQARAHRRQLVACVSENYVKTLAGWDGTTLPLGALAAAKAVLGAFDVVLVTEWLGHPATRAYLERAFCFETVTRDFPRAKRRNANASEDVMVSPSVLKKRAPGGHGDQRPEAWRPDAASLRRLEELNRLDAELYAWVADRVRATLDPRRHPPLPGPGETWPTDYF